MVAAQAGQCVMARVPSSWLKEQRQNKYRAKRIEVDGITFDSQKEAGRWFDLLNLQRARLITDLQRQVRFDLRGQFAPLVSDKGRRLSYVADFVYQRDGMQVIEDAKGIQTPEYKLKKAILRSMGHTVIEV
jgi:hypothetical protein